MIEVDEILQRPPFCLGAEARDWVRQTLAEMDQAQRLRHLFVHISMGDDPNELERLLALAPAGITRFFGDPETDLDLLDGFRSGSKVPPIISADLEGSRMSLPFGTTVPNALALAAVDDVAATHKIADITAREAKAAGVSWSFTPVLDINAEFRSPIVATRGFGSDPDRIARHALAQIEAMQANGVAATLKHWPGEGHDDRDQHLVTTVIPLSVDEWRKTHGSLYAAGIDAGVLSVMSAHIAFPAYMLEQMPDCGREAYRPASINRTLNQTLLRDELGFNGVIVSDASLMAGLTSWAPRDEYLPQVIENGCDIILFSQQPDADIARLETAMADGRLSEARVEEALIRVLGLKAKLGLHLEQKPSDRSKCGLASDAAEAKAIIQRAPTLVKDTQDVLPISPQQNKRVLIYSSGIIQPVARPDGGPEFILPDLLRAEGFDVTMFDPETQQDPGTFDLVIYLLGEETLLLLGRIFLDWNKIAGGLGGAMKRVWQEVPTVLLSFGYPYYLYDAPAAPCVVNAYSTTDDMQQAVVECLLGRASFEGTNPVDPFCGMDYARY